MTEYLEGGDTEVFGGVLLGRPCFWDRITPIGAHLQGIVANLRHPFCNEVAATQLLNNGEDIHLQDDSIVPIESVPLLKAAVGPLEVDGTDEGVLEDGDCRFGEVLFPDGSRYEGFLSEPGHAHGQGVYVSANGTIYDGQWRNGQAHGHGKRTHYDGSIYEGEWRFDEKSGSGIEWLAGGELYKGFFHRGRRHGSGLRSYDGGNYCGEFVDGLQEGDGTCTFFEDGSIYMGQWRMGQMDGVGRLQMSDGSSYFGEFSEGYRDGEGMVQWPDGRTYHGQWTSGVQDVTGPVSPKLRIQDSRKHAAVPVNFKAQVGTTNSLQSKVRAQDRGRLSIVKEPTATNDGGDDRVIVRV